jgi:hypothetical protein
MASKRFSYQKARFIRDDVYDLPYKLLHVVLVMFNSKRIVLRRIIEPSV